MYKHLIALVPLLSLAHCGGAPPDGAATQELMVPKLPPITPLPPASTDRMTWYSAWGNDAYWELDTSGVQRSDTFYAETADWYPAGVAGNRVLWQQQQNGKQTSLWTVDASGHFVAWHPLANPVPGHALATGLSLALDYVGECFHADDTQSYWVTWNDSDHNQFIVELIDGTGSVRLSRTMPLPFAGAAALQFGKAADGYDNMLFRGGDGSAYIYRMEWSTTAPTAQLTFKRSLSQPGSEASSINVHVYTPLLGGTQLDDQILFTNYNGDTAVLVTTNMSEVPLRQQTYSGTAGWFATAYTSLPSLCN